MNKLLAFVGLALIAAGTSLGSAAARPAPEAKLRDVVAPPQYGEWYCTKMKDRCDAGNQNACKLVMQYCD